MTLDSPILSVDAVSRRYRLPRRTLFGPAPRLAAVQDASLVVGRGEVLGIVGESGSGKSTLARMVMALERPDGGTIRIDGVDPHRCGRAELTKLRRRMQMVFQDPFGSLDPRRDIGWSVAEPLLAASGLAREERRSTVLDMLGRVGIDPDAAPRYPHEFSGGQRQRIAIARALVTRPALLVADEPVASLDVSVQAQILNLLMDLHEEFGLSMLVISHDLAVIASICDRVAVMKSGRIVETGATRSVLTAPAHAYTKELVAAFV
ncbi:ATP-binding cassette domain-containing protein [Aquibium sp. ELW1220]|uniref:ATP-binding cassette domain-containing protein n=1 Tax=Aquibium sp. ELW1220 TaxID=2976766 RepID=UPI0025B0E42B|nr:ATP-binding cassette domain-containing protein [Aquibium sp. ELW1220]MDN2579816.1 ATP-binding cassette domain-containing protein [Aquibium sp. ELW1220]